MDLMILLRGNSSVMQYLLVVDLFKVRDVFKSPQ